jgi:hypothetical protein
MSTINDLPPVAGVLAKPQLRIMLARHGGGLPTMTKQNMCRRNARMPGGRTPRPIEP